MKELGVSDCWSMCGVGEGFEEGVVEKGVWVGNEASVVHVAVFGAKGDDTRHGVYIGGEAQTEEEGVVLLQLCHGGTMLDLVPVFLIPV